MQKASQFSRKDDHININLNEDVKSALQNGFSDYSFIHQALPEIDFNAIDTGTSLFGKTLAAPFLISSMTGGVEKAAEINRNLAFSALEMGIAMGVGSQRPMLEGRNISDSFEIRKYAPSILLFANIGAVQFNYGVSIDNLKYLVESIEADGLILHLNAMQEVFQPEGQVNFYNLLSKIEQAVQSVGVPIIVKEVGWGISGEIASRLESIGVAAIDVAGAGGTSWSQIEKFRSKDPVRTIAAEAFRDWGIPTADCIVDVVSKTKDMKIFASGGLSNGVEAAKSIALGADLCGFAGMILKAATISAEEILLILERLNFELRAAMFGVGAGSLSELTVDKLKKK